jgi:hypothetical protein
LPFIADNSRLGDALSVILAMETFHDRYPMYNLSPAKAVLLTREVKAATSGGHGRSGRHV